jgi:uncharacterized membrane protein YgcG
MKRSKVKLLLLDFEVSMMKRKFMIGWQATIFSLCACLVSTAWAQEPKVTFPAEGQDVRGEINVTWEGIPEGGYAMVFVNGQLRTATADTTLTLNTLPPNFPGDGPVTLTVRGINSGGRRTGESKVTFNIANNKVDVEAEEVRLLLWKPEDRMADVQRYRIFAESNATIDEGGGGGGGRGGGSSGGGSGGGDGGGAEWIPAPLDWQLTALLRRVVRDVSMVDGSANIRTVVDNAFQRQRQSEYGGGGESGGSGGGTSTKKKSKAPSFPTKAPWHYDEELLPLQIPLWEPAPETGTYFVKMVHQTGEEINATRKPTTIAIADLLPTFPKGPVKPGITWTTTMTFLSDLSQRLPINVEWRMLFTTFENIKTPAQREIRAAKLESRFQMPNKQAMDIALSLAAMSGAGGAGGGGSAGAESGSSGGGGRPGASGGRGATGGGAAGASGGAAAGAEIDPDTIKNARTNVSRVLWFDIAKRRVVSCQDRLNTYFEIESESGGEGGAGGGSGGRPGGGSGGGRGSSMGMGGSGAEGAEAPAEPTRVNYSLFVSTQLDDTIPEPSILFDRRRIIPTAHVDPSRNPDDITKPNNRDRTLVRDPSLDKALIPSN